MMDLSRKAAMFYGCEHSDLKPANGEFAFVGSLGGLYRLLLGCWRRETCAPRLQEKWSASNPTCGQCSITSFLVQDSVSFNPRLSRLPFVPPSPRSSIPESKDIVP